MMPFLQYSHLQKMSGIFQLKNVKKKFLSVRENIIKTKTSNHSQPAHQTRQPLCCFTAASDLLPGLFKPKHEEALCILDTGCNLDAVPAG